MKKVETPIGIMYIQDMGDNEIAIFDSDMKLLLIKENSSENLIEETLMQLHSADDLELFNYSVMWNRSEKGLRDDFIDWFVDTFREEDDDGSVEEDTAVYLLDNDVKINRVGKTYFILGYCEDTYVY